MRGNVILLKRNPTGGFDVLDAQRQFKGWTPSILKARHFIYRPTVKIGQAAPYSKMKPYGSLTFWGWEWNGRRVGHWGTHSMVGGVELEPRVLLDLKTGEVFRELNRPRGQIELIDA